MSEDNKTPAAPVIPGSPEHNAAMVAVAEGGGVQIHGQAVEPAATPDKPQRPDNVPEKFWDAEKGVVKYDDVLKSYVELEKSKARPALTDSTNKAPPAAAPAAPEKADAQKSAEAEVIAAKAEAEKATDDVAKAAAKTKVDEAQAKLAAANMAAEAAAKAAAKPALNDVVSKASQEYAENGAISDESYAALEAQGLSKDYVDAYVDGMKARAEVVTRQVYDAAGGENSYKAIQEWAAANLSEQEVAAANEAFNSGKLDIVVGQVKSLKSRYDAAVGTSGRRIEAEGGGGSPGAGSPFRSKEEVTAAMASPKYMTDPAFRADVAKRMAASMKANIDLGF